MYESETQDVIQARTLARISDSLDKREGSLIQTAVGPVAAELAQMYVALDGSMDEAFADTASREYLIRRAAERGLTPIAATYCVGQGEFNLADIDIGLKFACGDFTYTVEGKISDGKYKLTCDTAGTAPNGTTGTLLPLVTISGLTSAELTSILIYGKDEEDTETFRARYFDSFNAKSFGGNRADYKEKTLAISGVGAVKIYRASSISGDEGTSGGNVRLVILDAEYGVPSDDLVSLVKETFDPSDASGEGYGLAPLWHHVYVEAATATTVDITVTITYDSGYSYDELKDQIEAAIDAYFLTLKKSWGDNTTGLIVRTSFIQNVLIEIDGILDATVTALNGAAGNLTLGVDCIPVRGAIT